MNQLHEGKLFINGKWCDASDGATFDDINPADETLVGRAADATLADVSDAIGAAREAFDTTSWSTDSDFRRKCLEQLAAGLGRVKADLVEMTVLEAGIPFNQANLIDSTVEEVEWIADLVGRFAWETDLPVAEMLGMRSHRRVRQEPRGVVAAITPWNVPTGMNVGKSAPALATGNTVVLKPAPDTPLSAMILAEVIANETDIPPGVFNLITSNHNEVGGDGLTGDPRVNMFAFTGSTAVGQRIASRAAIGFRKVVLELGGKSANIILDDADLDAAVPYSVTMCMYNSGQGCLLPTRMVVHESLYDEVLERSVAFTKSIPWGDPHDPATVVGPMIRRGQLERMDGLVQRARDAGAIIATGGHVSHKFDKGFWYEPTVVTGVDEYAEISQTEVFGPVLTILKYSGGDDEAVRIANATPYGLGAYVQTTNPDRAWKIARAVRSGGVAIGPSFWVASDTPFGGYGASGLGREHGVEGFLEFLQAKAIATPA